MRCCPRCPTRDSAFPAPGERAGHVVRSSETGGQRDRARHREPGRWRLPAADATIAFSSAGEALRKLQWVSRDGLRTAAAGEPGPYFALSLSPSGRRVALQRREVTRTFSGADIWVLELATGVLSRVTSDQDFESDPSWSPDEKSLAFTARRQGTWQIPARRPDHRHRSTLRAGPAAGQPRRVDAGRTVPDFPHRWAHDPGGCGHRGPAAAGHRRRAGRHRGSSASVAGRALDCVQRERVGGDGRSTSPRSRDSRASASCRRKGACSPSGDVMAANCITWVSTAS